MATALAHDLRVPIRRIEEYSSIFVKERLVIVEFVSNVPMFGLCVRNGVPKPVLVTI